MNATGQLAGVVERLSPAERWMRGGLEACPLPGFFLSVEADMSEARNLIETYKAEGRRITHTTLFVHSVAQALAQNPTLHQMVSGSRRCRPGPVNIVLSVAGGGCSFVAPVLIVKDAATKSLPELADAIATGAPQADVEQRALIEKLNRWGWLIPGAWLKRAIMRFALSRVLWKNSAEAPAFQITGLPDVDQFVPMLLLTTGILGVGQVKEKPVCVNGQVRSAWQTTLSCCVDHRVWDGRAAAQFLNAVRQNLEGIGETDCVWEPEPEPQGVPEENGREHAPAPATALGHPPGNGIGRLN